MTVSRALRGDASVAAKRRKQIMMIAEEMGYILDRGASQLRTRKTGFVAVTVPSINNPNFADSVRGLTGVLEEIGLQVLLGFTDYSLEREEHIIGQLLRRKPEALVVTGSNHTQDTRDLLARASIPVIATWDEPSEPIGYSVGFSNAYAGSLMADHLMETGRKNIAFIGCHRDTDFRGQARARGFFDALERKGLLCDRYIEAGKPPLGAQQGAAAARQLLAAYPDTDAVMCVADSVAFGAISEFQRAGIEVPNRIAVAGFGAYDIGACSLPPITTIEPNAEEIGALTGKTIGQLLNGEGTTLLSKHKGKNPNLVIRASTAG